VQSCNNDPWCNPAPKYTDTTLQSCTKSLVQSCNITFSLVQICTNDHGANLHQGDRMLFIRQNAEKIPTVGLMVLDAVLVGRVLMMVMGL
jgi:hypothetical protein